MKGRNWTGDRMGVSVFTPCTHIQYILILNNPPILLIFLHINAILFIFSFSLAVILPNRYNIPWLVKNLMA